MNLFLTMFIFQAINWISEVWREFDSELIARSFVDEESDDEESDEEESDEEESDGEEQYEDSYQEKKDDEESGEEKDEDETEIEDEDETEIEDEVVIKKKIKCLDLNRMIMLVQNEKNHK